MTTGKKHHSGEKKDGEEWKGVGGGEEGASAEEGWVERNVITQTRSLG